jgi:hypothetical protein
LQELQYLLLGDICAIFAKTGADRLFTAVLSRFEQTCHDFIAAPLMQPCNFAPM